MNNKMKLYTVIGILSIIITLVIFFVPKIGADFGDIEAVKYLELGLVIFAEIVITFALVMLAKGTTLFLNSGVISILVIYFILTFLFNFILESLLILLTFAIVLNLIVIILVLVLRNTNSTLDKESKRSEEEINTHKKGSSF